MFLLQRTKYRWRVIEKSSMRGLTDGSAADLPVATVITVAFGRFSQAVAPLSEKKRDPAN